LLLTHHSQLHNRPCSISFPARALTKVGLTPQILRQTRLSDLAQRADPRMLAEAVGITKEAALHYVIGNVLRAEDAFPDSGSQTQPVHAARNRLHAMSKPGEDGRRCQVRALMPVYGPQRSAWCAQDVISRINVYSDVGRRPDEAVEQPARWPPLRAPPPRI
jgi:hypothetical protein